jgi:stress-induced morphogen
VGNRRQRSPAAGGRAGAKIDSLSCLSQIASRKGLDWMSPESVRRLLLAALPDADVKLVDLTGTEDHYEARIVSQAFEGKTLIEQHQLVYRALGDAIHGPIHAFALKTYTPQSWAKVVGG